MSLPFAVPINWRFVELTKDLASDPDWDMSLISELVRTGLSSRCGHFKYILQENKININKLFFNKEDIIKFIRSSEDAIPENTVKVVENNTNNISNSNNISNNDSTTEQYVPFYSKGTVNDNILLLKEYLKEQFVPNDNPIIDYSIIDNLNIKTLPDYYLNLQNKKLLSILSSKTIKYIDKEFIDERLSNLNSKNIEYINKEYIDDIMTSILNRNYILYDTSSKNRSGRGILGFISINVYDITKTPPDYNVFWHRRYNRRILPGYINWTCSFIADNTKNSIKRNLSIVESSIAKYMTDEVCKLMINEYREAWPKYKIHAVLLFSTTLAEARSSHLRNGKLMACTFLYEWKNFRRIGITMYKHFGIDGRYELTPDNTIGLATMYYMYPTDGTRFEKGSPLYDKLMTVVYYSDFSEYRKTMKTRSNISTRRINEKTGKDVQGYTEDAFKCLYQPQVDSSDLSDENAQRISFYRYNPNILGGRRRTRRRLK